MNIEMITGIGASIFSAASLVPQLIKVIREKDAENISLGMLVVLFIGLGLWIYYGTLKNDMIIMVSNTFSFIINLILGILAVKYKKNKST
jgi:MtN3 and saliva related transmembrane protein